MNRTEVAKAFDIHRFIDKLEEVSDIQDYYRLNHLSVEQREELSLKIADSLLDHLEAMGLKIEK